MPRLELGADGMVRFDGRIIAEISYFDQEIVDIIDSANNTFTIISDNIYDLDSSSVLDELVSELSRAGWWKS